MWKYLVGLTSLLAIASPAQADWKEASSEHFVIYADQSESGIYEFAEKLEKYHSAMEYVTGRDSGKISPSNRVTIFVVQNEREVRKLFGDTSSNVAGFYSSRAGGSVAFVPRVRSSRGNSGLSFSEIVLLHEYAHHFMYSNYGFAFPMWYSEGFAEFYASASFENDGSVWLGRPAQHRAYELLSMRDVPLELLLDTKAYTESKKDRKRSDSFYGRSWALFHYMTMSQFFPEMGRKGQMATYFQNLIDGKDALEAATDAFGDLDDLDKELDRYVNRRMNAFDLPSDRVSIGEIKVRELSKGADEIMPLLAESRSGVNTEEAAELLPKVREVAAEYPDDEFVQAALAEAEYDAGNDALAIAAADRALAQNPGNMAAHVQKIYALFRTAQDSEADDTESEWDEVNKAVVAANKAENDHPIPLIYFYRVFQGRGQEPTNLAIAGLEQALGLAPYDQRLRMDVAMQQMRDERFREARYTLSYLLLDPHGTGISDAAATMIKAIDEYEAKAEGKTTEPEDQSDS